MPATAPPPPTKPTKPKALYTLSNEPSDDWRCNPAIRGAYREHYPDLSEERAERAFVASGRAALRERNGEAEYRRWVAWIVGEHPNEAEKAAAAAKRSPSVSLSGKPAHDWAACAPLRRAYANRYGEKPSNERAFLRTAEALIADGDAKSYTDWAWSLLAQHGEH